MVKVATKVASPYARGWKLLTC